ncbi:alpha/beta fold hydrolase [Ktedonospora formicarum]|uniref:2-hydroxy-6-oxo-6-phenylhexa-2,4-dienoate hydrolase n=1 Tax=Ktedonospora formicarum TaxID=2778364 RepID=A0A8J3I8Y7_9CHLR|nr:alpha/beta hydrolase [Ktedonospora formicarum]GHO49403.1 2-hydroxy-6-oxo-6-phenylhexa-2,4-dienoate hydrolase [Ktedonospora formicarum]
MKCDLGEIEIFYETYGSGRPIVMLPGRPSDHRIMLRFMEPVFTQRDGWLRIYPDLPGSGLTPGMDHLATHDQMLETMLAFIDKVIPGQRFVLAGLSYGGYLSRGVLSHRAALIDGVLLCAPQVTAPVIQDHLPPKNTLVEDTTLVAQLYPGLADLLVVQSPLVVEAAHTLQAEVAIANHAFQERLAASDPFSIDVDNSHTPFEGPTLIITARQDNLCGYRDAWNLLDAFPRATFAVLDRAGHFVNIEQDTLCHTLMQEWLDRVEEATNVTDHSPTL